SFLPRTTPHAGRRPHQTCAPDSALGSHKVPLALGRTAYSLAWWHATFSPRHERALVLAGSPTRASGPGDTSPLRLQSGSPQWFIRGGTWQPATEACEFYIMP